MREVQPASVAAFRQRRHALTTRLTGPVEEIARRTCGLHAQVMSSAELEAWQRSDAARPGAIARALWEERRLVRTWCMRGTLHLLTLEQHATCVAAFDASVSGAWLRFFDLTLDDLDRVLATIAETLDGEPMTRRRPRPSGRPWRPRRPAWRGSSTASPPSILELRYHTAAVAERQTRWPQEPVGATPWRFKSSPPHQFGTSTGDQPVYELIETHGAPIKAWIRGVPCEEAAKRQLRNIATLPFIHKWVAAMPDVHHGRGSTVGCVIATRGAVIPAAVGVDIGCGMTAVQTRLHRTDLPSGLATSGRPSSGRCPTAAATTGAEETSGPGAAPRRASSAAGTSCSPATSG